MKPIVKSDFDKCNGEDCSVCMAEDKTVIEIRGVNGASCGYCGNQIFLCSPCAKRMKQELNEIDLG